MQTPERGSFVKKPLAVSKRVGKAQSLGKRGYLGEAAKSTGLTDQSKQRNLLDTGSEEVEADALLKGAAPN